MRRLACAMVVGGGLLVGPAPAIGATLCVPSDVVAGCPATDGNEPTIMAAVMNGHSGDTIVIAPGTYTESVDDMGTPYTFIGAGPTKTIIQGQGSPAMNVSSGSRVSNLGINLYNSAGNTGLMLAGMATNVAITATQPASTMNNIGVDLNGGSFSDGRVTLPVSGGDLTNYGGVIGSGTLSDSSITAAVGITVDLGGGMPTVHRVHVLADQGVLVGGAGSFTIDDSVIRTEPGAASEIGIGTSPAWMAVTFTARHVDIVGSGAAGSTGVALAASGVASAAVSAATLDSSIMRGYANSVTATATAGPFPAIADVNLDYCDYQSTQTTAGGGGTAMIVPHHPVNRDPRFVNATAADFHLQAGSPAIDAADPAPLAGGESATDLDRKPRVVAGRHGDAAVGDIGAYEFQPHVPTVHASVSPARVAARSRATFKATGADASAGDSVSFRWTFDDGAHASGATVKHAFRKAGRHRATVTGTDLDGFTAARTITITVTGPAISRLELHPVAFKAGAGTVITYREALAATTTFTVQRRSAHGGYVTVGHFTHADRAGANHLRFSGRLDHKPLAPGRYRLSAVPRDRAGVGPAVLVGFRIIS